MAGIMTLVLGVTVLAESGGFFANATLVNATAPDSITVSAVNIIDSEHNGETVVSTIEVNKGSIRMKAAVKPDAADQKVAWTVVDGTGVASIDRCGQLSAIANGTVTVTATSADYPDVTGQEIITISNQFEEIDLKTAAHYTILAETGISAAGITAIAGDIGVSPIAATAITGFGLAADPSNQFAASTYVTGKVYAANYTAPTPANLSAAIGDMSAAYTTGNGLVPPVATGLYEGNLSGQTLTGGIYKWSNTVLINDTLTLSGDATDFWVFQIAGGVTQAADTSIVLSGGARAENVFWLSAETIALGARSHFAGIALSYLDITVGDNCGINGRLLAQTHVSLGVNSVVNHPGMQVN